MLEYVNPVDWRLDVPDDEHLHPHGCGQHHRRGPTPHREHRVHHDGRVCDVPRCRTQTFETGPFDVTAIPSWVPYSITATGKDPAVLFSYSDRPVFQKLGFYREADV